MKPLRHSANMLVMRAFSASTVATNRMQLGGGARSAHVEDRSRCVSRHIG